MGALGNLLTTLWISCLIVSVYGATEKVVKLTDLTNIFEITTTPSKQAILAAGEDKVTITWKLNASVTAASSEYKTVSVKLCYAPISQVDRPWRKTVVNLEKDKTCPHKIGVKPYNNAQQTIDWAIMRDVPTGTYFVRAYVLDSAGEKKAYGQSTDAAKKQNLFQVQAISGRHTTLDIVSVVFSAFSVVSLFGFFYLEKKKAKKAEANAK